MSDVLPVQVEVWPIAADEVGLWLLSGNAPWVSGNVPLSSRVHAEVEAVLREHDVSVPWQRYIHSTSWHEDDDALRVTYVVVVEPRGLVAEQWTEALPITPEMAITVGPAQAGPALAPPTPRRIDVLLHGMRHLAHLLDTDASAQGAIGTDCQRHLATFAPVLASMYAEVAQ
jgi:hypothetical protein